ncbi:hypothetical protein G4G28_20190 [Massilia sp. Dwa41.01b]|uniref:hypothetical protein n=1 Tax=unclassified Massilia TaxID=2609279 RepID=UPI0016009894|nr:MULTISPECIES: hypothetical protein [unclassified Massilia]QNA90239.1 hypothetical protein G4G28_20190 [Massilia sp. Dwa41.01b]QNB01132.1 hypothetical protein G4G31_23790 [Massilia sp. Se16.2.3]
MKPRIALLSVLSLCLLLSACSRNKDDAADDTHTQAEAVAQDDAGAQSEEAPPPPPPVMDYWKVVGPLVAGDYSGACMRKPDARKMEASVKVGADGKASSNGLEVDFRESKKTMLSRQRDAKGQYTAMALFSVDEQKGGMLTVLSSRDGGKGAVNLERDDLGIMCSEVAGTDKLSAQPLYQVLAALALGKKQTVSCVDTKNLLVRRDTEVEFSDGVLRIGDASYAVKDALFETYGFDDAGRSVSLGVGLPDKHNISLSFDGAGKLTGVMGLNERESTHSCEAKQ